MPLWVVLLIDAIVKIHKFTLIMLAAMLLMQATHSLIVLGNVSSGTLSILWRLLLPWPKTAATFAHWLHKCLVCLIFAEIIATCAVQLGWWENFAPIRLPQIRRSHIRRVVIHLAQSYRLLLFRRVFFRNSFVCLLLILPRKIAAYGNRRLFVDINIYRSRSFKLARRYLVQRLI